MKTLTLRRLRPLLLSTFPLAMRRQGEMYFYDDAVVNVSVHSVGASAEVLDEDLYGTSLDWTDAKRGIIQAHCSCATFKGKGRCHHLWALVTELDERRLPPIRVAHKDLELVATTWPLGSQVLPPQKAAPQKAWRKSFDKLQAVGPKTGALRPQREILIVMGRDRARAEAVKFEFFQVESRQDGKSHQLTFLNVPENGDVRNAQPKTAAALRAIAMVAAGERTAFGGYHYDYRYGARGLQFCRTITLESARLIWPVVAESGRVFVNKNEGLKTLRGEEDLSLKAVGFTGLHLRVHEEADRYILSAWLQQAKLSGVHEALPLRAAEVEPFVPSVLFKAGLNVGVLDVSETERVWLEELRAADWSILRAEAEPFLEALLNQSEALRIEFPESLRWERVNGAPGQPEVNLRALPESEGTRYQVDLVLRYGGRAVSHSSPIRILPDEESRRIYERDSKAEETIFCKLPHELFARGRDGEPLVILSKNLYEFVQATLRQGLPVVVENKRVQEWTDFTFEVTSGVDWFDVEGQAEFCGRWVKFPAILEAVRRGEKFVPLGADGVGFVDERMAKRLEKLTAFAQESNREGLRFGSAQGLLLNTLLEDEKNVRLDAKFQKLRQDLASFSGIAAGKTVPSFKGKLREYQSEGLGWLEFLQKFGLGGILADDMGLGKTIQCLAFLECRRLRTKTPARPSLLIAPKSLLDNWKSEAERFTPQMNVLIHAGLERGATPQTFGQYDLVVTTYQTMLRDLEMMRQIPWDCVILDEAQMIKNPEALVSKATKTLSSQFRLAMTGTPIENSIQDLVSIVDFVNPGLLVGRLRAGHIKLEGDVREVLSRALKPVLLRRTKAQVLKDLPDKTEQVVSVELESKQQKIYNELKRFYQAQIQRQIEEKGIRKSQIQILAALTRLRQVALHPGLIDAKLTSSKSAKFGVVLEMLEEVIGEGHRVLVFSQFTSLLALFKMELVARKIEFCYLDGKTGKRREVVGQFKNSKCPVFLMSLKAGGVGLNLVEADYVFLLDPWWNPAVEAQAIDRVHRIGQKRAVNAYRFIAKNTVEEKILELQNSKRGLYNDMLGEGGGMRSLTAQDLESLFAE